MVDLSIIIPVYNVEKYIEECIESVLNQNLDSFEVIIVNDGSTDKSMERIKKFLDNRFIIINQKNLGLSSARNTGLKNAKGKYILFLDSDDKLKKNTLNELVSNIKRDNLDILLCNHKKFDEKYVVENKRCNEIIKSNIMNGFEMLKLQLKNRNYCVQVWDDIYNTNFLISNNLLFKEGIIYEDEEFMTRVLLKAKKVKYENNSFYLYRQRMNSITKKAVSEKNYKSLLEVIKSLINILNNECDEFKEILSLQINNLIEIYIELSGIHEKKYLKFMEKEIGYYLESSNNKNLLLKFLKNKLILYFYYKRLIKIRKILFNKLGVSNG